MRAIVWSSSRDARSTGIIRHCKTLRRNPDALSARHDGYSELLEGTIRSRKVAVQGALYPPVRGRHHVCWEGALHSTRDWRDGLSARTTRVEFFVLVVLAASSRTTTRPYGPPGNLGKPGCGSRQQRLLYRGLSTSVSTAVHREVTFWAK